LVFSCGYLTTLKTHVTLYTTNVPTQFGLKRTRSNTSAQTDALEVMAKNQHGAYARHAQRAYCHASTEP
jgi:hypothetical protein